VRVFDKPPIFCRSLDLDRDSAFPVAVELACEILAVDGDVVTISTLKPWDVSTEDGRSEFAVFAWQLIEDVIRRSVRPMAEYGRESNAGRAR
jgi:hypothetical protein